MAAGSGPWRAPGRAGSASPCHTPRTRSMTGERSRTRSRGSASPCRWWCGWRAGEPSARSTPAAYQSSSSFGSGPIYTNYFHLIDTNNLETLLNAASVSRQLGQSAVGWTCWAPEASWSAVLSSYPANTNLRSSEADASVTSRISLALLPQPAHTDLTQAS